VKELVLLSEVNHQQTQALKAGSHDVVIIYSGSFLSLQYSAFQGLPGEEDMLPEDKIFLCHITIFNNN
jgi:hypothetical protein